MIRKMERIEQKLRLLKPILPDAQWKGLRLQYLMESDPRKQRDQENIMDMLLAQQFPGLLTDEILLPPLEPDKLDGEYRVGEVVYGPESHGLFGVREAEWIKHCGLFGKTGSGKTTLAVHLIKQICNHDKPFLIFDYKRNYRDLLRHPAFANQEIMVFTVGRNDVVPFLFNPKNKPPGVEEHVWIKQLAQIIEKVYLLGPGANDVFMEASDERTFAQMQEQVLKQKKKARELLWWASVKRTLNAINYPGLGDMVNCIEGHSIPDLLNKKVILELDGLSGSDQAFVIGSLLLWIYHYRMRQPEREVLKHFIIIEEAHHLFLANRREEDIADVIMREIRELGEAMIIIDQHPSKMSVSALGNLSTKFCLSMSLNQDVQAVANAMLLDKDQRRYLSMLTLGRCICRSDRLTQPILLKIPPFDLEKGKTTDEDLKKYMSRYSAITSVKPAPMTQPGNVRGYSKPEILSPLGRILLADLASDPLLGLVKRFKKLGLKLNQGYKVQTELEGLGLLKPVTIDGKKLFDLTLKGRQALGKKYSLAGRGGLEHRYYVEQIKAHYLKNEGFTFLEKDDIDLVVESYDHRLAVQVETGKSDMQGNIIKLGKYPADHKYMIATNPETETKLKEMLRDLLVPDRENIKVSLAKDFLSDPPIL